MTKSMNDCEFDRRQIGFKLVWFLSFLTGGIALGMVFFKKPMLSATLEILQISHLYWVRSGVLICLVAGLSLFWGLSIFVLTLSLWGKEPFPRGMSRLTEFAKHSQTLPLVITLFALVVFISSHYSLAGAGTGDELQGLFLDTTRPIFVFLAVNCSLWMVFLSAARIRFQQFAKATAVWTALLFLVLLGFLLFFSHSPYGYWRSEVEYEFFRLTGYPILGYQVLFALGLSAGLGWVLSWVWSKVPDRFREEVRFIDLAIVLLIVAGAFLLWSQPALEANAFIDPPRPPNQEFTPALDAIFYDRTAQNLLAAGHLQSYLAEGVDQHIGRRPLLAVFYALLHAGFGLGYEKIIPAQIMIFTLFPVLVYFVGRSLHSRTAGMMAAILIILRQFNGLVLGGEVTGTNLHMVMSDIPASIGVVLFILLFLRWLKFPERSRLAIFSGGVLGLTMLIRPEVGILIPFSGLAALIYLRKEIGTYVKKMVLMGLSLMIVLLPWVWRNWNLTGKVYLDHFYQKNLVLDFFDEVKERTQIGQPAPQPTRAEKSEQEGDGGPVVEEGKEKPREAPLADDTLNHFSNGFIQSFLYLPNYPLALDLDYLSKVFTGHLGNTYGGWLYTPEKYVKVLPYWRQTWTGKISFQSLPLLVVNLFLIAMGVVQVWKRQSWAVMVPVLGWGGYIAIYAVVNRSGGRFLLPVDWVVAMFFSVGAVETLRNAFQGKRRWPVLDRQGVPEGREAVKAASAGFSWQHVFFLAVFFLLGSSPVLIEEVYPNRYSEEALRKKTEALLTTEGSPFSAREQAGLVEFLAQDGEVVYGRALYPRYFAPGKETMESVEYYFQSNTTFYVSGSSLEYGVLPIQEVPEYFPHGVDVVAFGCPGVPIPSKDEQVCLHCPNRGFDVLAVVIYGGQGEGVEKVLWRAGDRESMTSCPLTDIP